MKKLKVIKLVMGLGIGLSFPTHVYTATEPTIQKEENHSSTAEKETEDELAADSEEKEEDSKPVKLNRTSFGFDKLPEGNEQPWRLIRGLQRLQDNIVQGKPRSQDAYKLLLSYLAKVLGNQDTSVWQHERNLDAVAVYLLLGGNTELGYEALQKTNLNNLQKQPLEAAIAFAERDLEKAYELLLKLDHLALPPSMSAQFALAKSMVVSSTSLDLALKYLREARRLAPGTLIEEGAIRRSIRIAGEKKANDDFVQLTRTYLRRFRKSHYFNDFLRNFGFALVRMPRQKEAEVLKFLQEVLPQIDDTQKVAVAAYVARHATISGRRKMSSWSSKMALEKIVEGSLLYDRMQLYSASADIVNQETAESALANLETILLGRLDQTDQQIFDAAKVLGKQILQDSTQLKKEEYMPKQAEEVVANVDEKDENIDDSGENQFVQRASKLLASSESALEKVTQ